MKPNKNALVKSKPNDFITKEKMEIILVKSGLDNPKVNVIARNSLKLYSSILMFIQLLCAIILQVTGLVNVNYWFEPIQIVNNGLVIGERYRY